VIIDKLGGVNPLNNVQSSQRVSARSSVSFGSDSISVSAEAQELAEALYLSEVAAETPDVRTDLVEQIRIKIQDPMYLSDAVIDSTVDNIMASYFGV